MAFLQPHTANPTPYSARVARLADLKWPRVLNGAKCHYAKSNISAATHRRAGGRVAKVGHAIKCGIA